MLLHDLDTSKLTHAPAELERIDQWLAAEFPESTPTYGRIKCTADISVLDRHADFILECIREDISAKAGLFHSFRLAKRRGVVFSSCTSGLSISEMGDRSGCQSQLLGTHFWSPPHLMPLVEVVRGGACDEAVETCTAFCRSLGKQTVLVKLDVPGFIGNRMLHALWREAIHIVERGIASAEDVDLVAKLTFALRQTVLGPLEHMDLAGLDLIEAIQKYLLADLAANQTPGELLQQMVRNGRLGVKSGNGFYKWRDRDATSLIQARDRQVIYELRRIMRASGLAANREKG